ncbi:MAG: transglycosylase [Prolixibacteraceae bacterium]|nr:transglycosylase [Prolixibacteraceae bacterium]
MRTTGIVLLIIGFAGVLVFGIQAVQDTETFSFLGIDIGVSGANWTPVIISAIVLVIGIVITGLSRRTLVYRR